MKADENHREEILGGYDSKESPKHTINKTLVKKHDWGRGIAEQIH